MKNQQSSQNLDIRHLARNRKASVKSVRLVWLTFISLFILIVWATFFQLDTIIRGSGQIVPFARVQEIQNLEGCILREVIVKEGQEVEVNELLARIENESAGSQYREALARSLDYKATIARLIALIEEKDVHYPDEVLAYPDLITRHNTILKAMQTQMEAEYNVLQLQANAQEKQATELEAEKKQVEAHLEIAEKQRKLAEITLKQRAFSEIDYLELKQKVMELQSRLVALEHSIPRLHIEAQEKMERIKRYKAEKHLEDSHELAKTQAELISLEELLTAGSDKVMRTELRAPVRGIVKRIYQNTLGGVVAPGATIMDVVPLDDSLIVEARFSPADIGFLTVGLQAIIRLSAYDFTTYGSIKGLVEQVSADTLQDNQGNIFYIVKVRTTQKLYNKDGVELPFIAGMQAEVDVITGKQSILKYLFKPLLRIGNRALTEQ